MDIKNNKLTRSALYLSKHASLFICPLCDSSMKVQDLRSLICTNRHSFDIAKQGYLNLLNQKNKTNYDKALFEARRKVIANSGFFDDFNIEITDVINKQSLIKKNLVMIDMGSGEGTHLENISNRLKLSFDKKVTGIGFDISREGILEAARHYEENIWVVADLASTPIADRVSDIIINILSPSNYEEFNRVLKDDGVVVKVVPRQNYLKELRHHFYEQSDREEYSNTKVVDHFKKHFTFIDERTVHYTHKLDQAAMTALVKMTPLTWNVDDKAVQAFIDTGISEVTVDLAILVGKKK